MNIKDHAEHMKRYGATRETMDMVNDIFIQGDNRYDDFLAQASVAGFIANDALSIDSKTLKDPKSKDISDIKGPQQDLKRIAAHLLRKRGFTVQGCEISGSGGTADMVGVKGKKRILVECGPCRIDKPVCYLESPDIVLWVLTPCPTGVIFHEITRGQRWEEFLKFHKEEERKMKERANTAMDTVYKRINEKMP